MNDATVAALLAREAAEREKSVREKGISAYSDWERCVAFISSFLVCTTQIHTYTHTHTHTLPQAKTN